MTHSVARTAGDDISKDQLDVCLHPNGAPAASPMTSVASPPSSPGWLNSRRPASSSKRSAPVPKPTTSMPPCWQASAPCSNPRCARLSAPSPTGRANSTLHPAHRKDSTTTQNRQKSLCLALLKGQAERRLLQIKEQFNAIGAELVCLVKTDPGLQIRFNSLVSIPGVGSATAFAPLIEMLELGTLEHRHAASLAGLAPVTRESR